MNQSLSTISYPGIVHPGPKRVKSSLRFHKHFELINLQEQSQQQKEVIGAERRLHYFEIIWCITGTGEVEADSKTGRLTGQQLYILVPGQVRRLRLTEVQQGYYISFSPDFLSFNGSFSEIDAIQYRAQLGRRLPGMMVEADTEEKLAAFTSRLQKEYQQNLTLRTEMISGIINLLFMYVARQVNAQAVPVAVSKEAELVQQYLQLARKEFLKRKRVAEYAALLNVTPNYLNTAVKNVTGVTASYQVQQLIINEAKRQLIEANRSMKEISYHLGFDNVAHFSKYFKAKTGTNFTSFRNRV